MENRKLLSNHFQKFSTSFLCLLFFTSIIGLERDKERRTKTLPYQHYQDKYNAVNNDADQVQLVRKSQVITSCMQKAGHGTMKPMNPYYFSKFFPASLRLEEDGRIGWCHISKVGTKQLSDFLLILNQKQSEDQDLSKTYLIRPRDKLDIVRGEQWADYFKFLIVRHPFIRLVSAYKSRGMKTSSGGNVSFPDFVDHLIRTPPNLMDKHWAPYTKVCIPCNISYDAILKVETLKSDADWLLAKLKLNHLQEDWGKLAATTWNQTTSESTRKYFSQVSQENIWRLYIKYQIDFEMFNYENQIEEFIDMGYL